MAYTYNVHSLIGRLGKDPETKYTPSGTAVTKFSVATEHSYKQNDQWQKETDWHNVVCWAKKAEVAQEYLHKGDLVFVSGRSTTRSWEDRDGKKHYTTEVVADELILLGGRSGGSGGGGGERHESQGYDQRRRDEGGGGGGGGRDRSGGRRGNEVTADNPITDEDVPF